jgi:hypothetical protein
MISGKLTCELDVMVCYVCFSYGFANSRPARSLVLESGARRLGEERGVRGSSGWGGEGGGFGGVGGGVRVL